VIEFVGEFVAKQTKTREFEEYYSTADAWTKLFPKSPSYCGTVLLRDAEQPGRYLTLDRWDAP
jgi:hypothetical protein